MKSHLTDEELSEWLAGVANHEAMEHCLACAACRNEAQALRAGITDFAFAVRAEAARAQAATANGRSWLDPAPWQLNKILAAVAALLLFAAVLFLVPHGGSPPAAVARQDADDLLLKEINADIQREVPSALEPAAVIVAERNRLAGTSLEVQGENQ